VAKVNHILELAPALTGQWRNPARAEQDALHADHAVELCTSRLSHSWVVPCALTRVAQFVCTASAMP
jgi:hypothetical protein